MSRIIVYSHDTFGLGNIRRMLAIATHLADKDPESSILLLSGSPMLHAFRLSPRIDYVKLPCLRRNEDGSYDVRSLGLSLDAVIRLRGNIILNTLLDFEPDLILVDKKPAGVSGELLPALDAIKRHRLRPKLVLLLRDILDEPKNTQAVWQRNRYHELIEDIYDLVLVVGTKDIFDTCSEYRFPKSTNERLRYCGYLRRPHSILSAEDVRVKFGISQRQIVLVTAGGGEDGHLLFETYLRSLAHVGNGNDFASLVLLGPEIPTYQRQKFAKLVVDHKSVHIVDFTDDIMSYMQAADLVVSMGGYNTVCEIMAARKRSIIVPRVKPVLEQWIRAKRLGSLGLTRAIHPDALNPSTLGEAVLQELTRTRVSAKIWYQIEMNGLAGVAYWVSRLLGDEFVQPHQTVDAPSSVSM